MMTAAATSDDDESMMMTMMIVTRKTYAYLHTVKTPPQQNVEFFFCSFLLFSSCPTTKKKMKNVEGENRRQVLFSFLSWLGCVACVCGKSVHRGAGTREKQCAGDKKKQLWQTTKLGRRLIICEGAMRK